MVSRVCCVHPFWHLNSIHVHAMSCDVSLYILETFQREILNVELFICWKGRPWVLTCRSKNILITDDFNCLYFDSTHVSYAVHGADFPSGYLPTQAQTPLHGPLLNSVNPGIQQWYVYLPYACLWYVPCRSWYAYLTTVTWLSKQYILIPTLQTQQVFSFKACSHNL